MQDALDEATDSWGVKVIIMIFHNCRQITMDGRMFLLLLIRVMMKNEYADMWKTWDDAAIELSWKEGDWNLNLNMGRIQTSLSVIKHIFPTFLGILFSPFYLLDFLTMRNLVN